MSFYLTRDINSPYLSVPPTCSYNYSIFLLKKENSVLQLEKKIIDTKNDLIVPKISNFSNMYIWIDILHLIPFRDYSNYLLHLYLKYYVFSIHISVKNGMAAHQLPFCTFLISNITFIQRNLTLNIDKLVLCSAPPALILSPFRLGYVESEYQ
jgi:hypothetical protein